MDFVYLYIDSYRGLNKEEFNFGYSMRFRCDKNGSRVKITMDKPDILLPTAFWQIQLDDKNKNNITHSSRISNVSMIVGENGSGKTSVMHCIIDFLRSTVYKTQCEGSGAFVFMEDGEVYLFVIPDEKQIFDADISIKNKKIRKYTAESSQKNTSCDEMDVLEKLWKTKLIYITNTLNISDYNRAYQMSSFWHNTEKDQNIDPKDNKRYDFLYDCSLGAQLYLTETSDRQNINNDSNDVILMYYFHEKYRQVKYAFDARQYEILKYLDDQGLPVPLPQKLVIEVTTNFESILKEKHFVTEVYFQQCYNMFVEHAEKENRMKLNFQYYVSCGCILNILSIIIRVLSYDECKTIFDEYFYDDLNVSQDKEMNYWFNLIINKILNNCKKTKPDDHFIKKINNMINNIKSFFKIIYNNKLFETFDIEQPIQYSNTQILRFYIKADRWLPPINNQNEKYKIPEHTKLFIDFIKLYRWTLFTKPYLDFSWDFSSGENNIFNLYSSLYFIFTDDYSDLNRFNDKSIQIYNNQYEGKGIIECDNVLLLIDEVDLTFHPEWQRKLVKLLIALLPRMYLNNVTQMILTTHSPIILSDIPQNNINFLSKKKTNADLSTFGQNIHTLLADSFFMEITIGEFAKAKIDEAYILLKKLKKRLPNLTTEDKDHLKQAKKIIDLIGEEIIRKSLLSEYYYIKNNNADKTKNLPIWDQYKALPSADREAFKKYLLEEDIKNEND